MYRKSRYWYYMHYMHYQRSVVLVDKDLVYIAQLPVRTREHIPWYMPPLFFFCCTGVHCRNSYSGHALNSQLGPSLPTELPSEQIFASIVHAIASPLGRLLGVRGG